MADWKDALRDLGDILGRARSPAEAAKAFVPPSLQRRRVLNETAPLPGDLAPGEVARELRKLSRRLKGEALVGELHMPGFSAYLHPMGDDHLLAVGMAGLGSKRAATRATISPSPSSCWWRKKKLSWVP